MRTETKPAFEPIHLTKAEARLDKENLTVAWGIDDKALPMFEFKLNVFEGSQSDGSKVSQSYSEVKPHGRSAMIALGKSLLNKSLTVEVLCFDILGNSAKRLVEVQR